MSSPAQVNGHRHDRQALIVYGSETGTAQDVAEELQRLTRRLYFTSKTCDLDSISLNELSSFDIVLCAISTTGQGDLPTNSRGFWKRLRSARLASDCLQNVQFASFGLGDSSYPRFNWAHRKLYSRLKQLGAQTICERGEADQQHPDGVDGAFMPWISKLRDALLEQYPLPSGQTPIPDDEFLAPEWILSPKSSDEGHHLNGHLDEDFRSLASWDTLMPALKGRRATLTSNELITPTEHWQDVRLLNFTLPPSSYSPGDVLTIYPKNFESDVSQLIELQGWISIADSPLAYTPTIPSAILSTDPLLNGTTDIVITLRALLTHHLDITSIPRRSFFSSIAHFTSDPAQKERLLEFTQPDYLDEFYDYTTRPRRSILEVLQEFHTVKIPFKYVLSVFPTIRGRQFSIASGGALKSTADGSTRIQLLVAIVKYRTVIKKLRLGLCTRYLAVLQPGAHLNVTLIKGGMKIDPTKPALMIGPGTGIAPLRSMIHERLLLHQQTTHQDQAVSPEQLLFFGCRNRAADFFFSSEWHSLCANPAANLTLHVAFSRDQRAKIYVQDLIRQQSAQVHALLQRGGVVYLCGSSGEMPKAVREALIHVFENEEGVGRQEAEAKLQELEKAGRYQQETW